MMKKNEKRYSKSKHILNNKAVDHMTVEMLKDNNGYDEMKEWFEEISRHISPQR